MSADLFYRAVVDTSFTVAAMEVDGTTYSADIHAGAVTTAGVEYYFEASDGEHTSRLPMTKNYLVSVAVNGPSETAKEPDTTFLKRVPLPTPEADNLSGDSPFGP